MSATLGKGGGVSIAKVVEITATSPKSFEDAIHSGVSRAAKTLEGIQGAWIKEQKIVITGGKVTEFRVNMSVTFLLKD